MRHVPLAIPVPVAHVWSDHSDGKQLSENHITNKGSLSPFFSDSIQPDCNAG